MTTMKLPDWVERYVLLIVAAISLLVGLSWADGLWDDQAMYGLATVVVLVTLALSGALVITWAVLNRRTK